jgi:hypothetical protein
MTTKLKKVGTMQIAAKEGMDYLKKSWTTEKYDRMKRFNNFGEIDGENGGDKSTDTDTEQEEEEEKVEKVEPKAKKPKLSKNTTMLKTLEASEHFLKDVDSTTKDAKTRHQAKAVKRLLTTPPTRQQKPRLVKNSTMVATTAESKVLLKGAGIDPEAKTRGQSKINKAEKRQLKKGSTMVGTAKEGLAFLARESIRSRKRKATEEKVKK